MVHAGDYHVSQSIFPPCSSGTPSVGAPTLRRWRAANTLTETIFVLAIAVMLVALGLLAINVLVNDSQARSEIVRLGKLADAARQLRTPTGYPTSTVLQERLLQYGMVPSGYLLKGDSTSLTHSWGGEVRVTTQDGGGNFAISYTKVPKVICYLMVMLAPPSGVLKKVGAGVATSNSAAGDLLLSERTALDLPAICTNGTVHWATGETLP